MPERASLVLVICLISHQLISQNVEWASEVIDFSSEASPVEFSSVQLLGKPNVLPATEISPNCWSPGKVKKEHFVTVGFKKPLNIRQTAIAEAYNAGTIKEVYAYDPENHEYLLYSLEPKPSDQKGRMFNFFLNKTTYKVNRLKIVFDGRMFKGNFFIDAIGISDSNVPIRASVNEDDGIRENLVVRALDENINSHQSEIRPLLSPDGKTLFFSRKNSRDNIGGEKDEEDVWRSTYNEKTQTWEPAKNIGAPLNNGGKNFINAISSYGDLTIAVLGNEYKGDKMRSGMSVSNTTKEGWSQPVTINFSNDPDLIGDFDFTLSNDRKMIIVAVQRGDTHGGKDLYVSFLQRTAVWSEPMNLGSIINTVGEESSPFLDADGETLYFSSKGFSGFGQSDIYVSKRLDDTWKNWSEPQNLGPEINSEFDDKYFNIPLKGDKAYFSRYVTPENADIYSVSLPLREAPTRFITIEASIVDDLTGIPVESNVSINESALTGNSFRVDMEAGKIYQCHIEANGYLVHDELLDLTNEDIGETLQVEIALRKKEEKLTFDNIIFASNQAMLLERSFANLDEVARIMDENDDVFLEIASHTDNIGSEEDNLSLSRLRAEAILVYLADKGVDPERMTLSWYGESRPVASNDTPEGRRKNRRVEFIIKR